MLKAFLIIIVVALGGFAIVASLQPDDFRVTRSETIAAPVDVVFAKVNNVHTFQTWSPWAEMEPEAKIAYEGPEAGVGAIFSWDGKKVGTGKSTTTEVVPNERIVMQLDFLKPMATTNTAEFTFKAAGDSTIVTWSMYGKNNFISKAINLVVNCEKMVGAQFEQGLKNLKAQSE